MDLLMMLALGLACGAGAGYWACWRRSEAVRMEHDVYATRWDAYRETATEADLDVVGPVTPAGGTAPAATGPDGQGVGR